MYELKCSYVDSGYLFEGHLTVDPEPPQPQWLVQSNLLTAAAAALSNAESSQGPAENSNTSENATNILQALIENLDNAVDGVMFVSYFSEYFPHSCLKITCLEYIYIITTSGDFT